MPLYGSYAPYSWVTFQRNYTYSSFFVFENNYGIFLQIILDMKVSNEVHNFTVVLFSNTLPRKENTSAKNWKYHCGFTVSQVPWVNFWFS